MSGGFVVRLARTGRDIAVPAGQSILQALEEAGLTPAHSCRSGTCGSCETTVLEGAPLHRDGVLTEAERLAGRTMMICRSRSRSPLLVLDL